MAAWMRGKRTLRLSRARSGALSSSERGVPAISPPDTMAVSQCRLLLSIVRESVRKTCSQRKLPHTRSSSATARQKRRALLASTTEFTAPADVPLRIGNGFGARGGSSSASALSTPTWNAPRAPPPGSTSAVLRSGGRSLMRSVQPPDARLEPGQGQRKHAPVHQLARELDGRRPRPTLFRLRVEPDRLRVRVEEPPEPHGARLLVPMLHAAAGIHDLVRAHRGIADEDQLVARPVLVGDRPRAHALLVAPAVVPPQALIDEVVEIEVLEVLELGTRRGE